MSADRHQYVPDAMAMGDCRVCGHVEASERHGLMTPDEVSIGGYYRHKKTGGTYQVLMIATMEATMMPVVIYSARQKNGATPNWVRPIDEFCGGRFEPVDMATVPLTKLSRT